MWAGERSELYLGRAKFKVPVEPPGKGAEEATGHMALALSEEGGAGNDQRWNHQRRHSICLHWPFYPPHEEGLLVPMLVMRKVRLRGAKSPAHSHRAGKSGGQDLN